MQTNATAVQVGLLEAIRLALQVLDAKHNEDQALRDSFRAAAEGLGAERSFLGRVNGPGDVTDVLEAHGLGAREIDGLCSGRSCPGVSVSVVRRALLSGHAQHVEDTRLMHGDLERTDALVGGEWSVVCAPVIEPRTHSALAVLYFQTHSLTHPLGAAVVPHVEAYALALAQVWYLWRRVQHALETARAEAGDVAELEIVGDSPRTVELRARLHKTILPAMRASRPDPVLILGPTGVGKDLVARYLHAFSGRGEGPFVAVNCASLRGELVEKELFGHVLGAYTGAVGDSPGRFTEAQGGVLFLDEIGDLPAEGQALLLRAIDTRRARAVGGREERTLDVQIVCATNVALEEAVAQRRFRADLYHRIRGLTIHVAPLAQRAGDIVPLLAHYLALHERRYRKRTLGLAPRTREMLLRYAWPGNVRELAAVASALVAHTPAGRWIAPEVLHEARPEIHAAVTGLLPEQGLEHVLERPFDSLQAALVAMERAYLVRVGDALKWNRSAMARRLRLDRKSLYRRLRRTGLHEAGEAAETLEALEALETTEAIEAVCGAPGGEDQAVQADYEDDREAAGEGESMALEDDDDDSERRRD